MARNEEKQLARLNRFYLQQQKEEQLKKRPPRPRLEALKTVNEIKKWLPSIMKDIEFYVSQMEVSCYPARQIEEFEQRLNHLRGEYKAFVHKIRQLEPDIDATPWTDRPYAGKQRKLHSDNADVCAQQAMVEVLGCSVLDRPQTVTLLDTPVLHNDSFYKTCYGYVTPHEPVSDTVDPDLQSKPLDFDFSKSPSSLSTKQLMAGREHLDDIKIASHRMEVSSLLNLPYSDSSSDDGD
ncbi:hypothetical protein Btru_034172 [Bulinus truncatus]|nr:hypothetical protein Btru_034172 [Bulinus truncatus]